MKFKINKAEFAYFIRKKRAEMEDDGRVWHSEYKEWFYQYLSRFSLSVRETRELIRLKNFDVSFFSFFNPSEKERLISEEIKKQDAKVGKSAGVYVMEGLYGLIYFVFKFSENDILIYEFSKEVYEIVDNEDAESAENQEILLEEVL